MGLLQKSFLALALGASMLGVSCQKQQKRQVLHPAPFPTRQTHDFWQAAESSTPITIDGTLEEAWQACEVKTIWMLDAIDGTKIQPIFVRALWYEDMVYISAQWKDDEKNDMPRAWEYNENARAYERSSAAEDMFSVAFEMSGDLLSTMLTTRGYTADVWHWKAGRGNETGYADDKRTIVSPTSIKGAQQWDLYNDKLCWIDRPADAGRAPYREVQNPGKYQSVNTVASYESVEPDGSRADVRARGVHHDGSYWTLEFARRRATGHDDDANFNARRPVPVTVALFNASRDIDHLVSPLMHLRFYKPTPSEIDE